MIEERHSYRPSRLNPNWLIHRLFYPAVPAFHPSAVVTMQKRFPDVSHWQGNINWDVMRSKTDAVIIRIGTGVKEDPQFRTNWAEAKKRGMYRGAYWFYDDTVSPGSQAQRVYDAIRYDPPEMEIAADWETTYKGSYGGLKNVVAFMESIEAKMGRLKCTSFYTGYYWFVGNSNPVTHASQYRYLAERPLWLAWYIDNPAVVKVPAPWSKLHLWQYGTPVVGAEYGAQSKELDMNYFNGDESFFYQYYGGVTVPPPTGPKLIHKLGVYDNGSVKEL